MYSAQRVSARNANIYLPFDRQFVDFIQVTGSCGGKAPYVVQCRMGDGVTVNTFPAQLDTRRGVSFSATSYASVDSFIADNLPFTLCFLLGNLPATAGTVFSTRNSTTTIGVVASLSQSSVGIALKDAGAGITANFSVLPSATIGDRQQRSVFIAYDGSGTHAGLTLYIDGKQVPWTASAGSLVSTIVSGNQALIGASRVGTAAVPDLTDGLVHTLAVYPFALTEHMAGILDARMRAEIHVLEEAKYTSDADSYQISFTTTDTTQNWVIRTDAGIAYWFDWGDGSALDSYIGTGGFDFISHNYSSAGTYTIRFMTEQVESLDTLNSQNNGVTGTLTSLDEFTGIRVLSLDRNQLSGPIPSLSNNPELEVFYCFNNQLTGSIPSLAFNPALEFLYCYNNLLTGSIPSLASNVLLQHLQCNRNQLTGVIPSLSANVILDRLYVADNQLTGYTASTIATTCTHLLAENNLLVEAAVDQIMGDFLTNAAARPAVGQINVGGTGNAPLSAAGLASKAAFLAIRPLWVITNN